MLKYGLAITSALLLAAPSLAAPVDLSGWVAEGYPGQHNWVLRSGNNAVLQTYNGYPTVFYSSGNAQGKALSGSISVQSNGDDDYIGFLLGFTPGGLQSSSTDYLLIDWKKADQGGYYGCVPPAGLAISHVSAGLGEDAGAWCHNPDNGVTELQRAATLGDTGWQSFEEYVFTLEFTSTNVKVFVNDNLEIDLDGTFSNGAFGFYNYSQANVLYAGIQEDELPPVTGGVPEPASWALMIAGFGLVGAAVRRRSRRALA